MTVIPASKSMLLVPLICSYAGAQVTLTDLGVLQPSDDGSFPTDVSADGMVVVGIAASTSGSAQAFRWTPDGGMEGLGFCLSLATSIATGVSDDGSIVVGYCYNGNDALVIPFRWTPSSGIDMIDSTIPGCTWGAAGNYAYATGISGDGSVIVGFGCANNAQIPIRWISPEEALNIGGTVGIWSMALATNHDGSRTCGITRNSNAWRASIFGTGDPQLLTTLPAGSPSSTTSCLSANGLLVGGWCSEISGGGSRAVRWNETGQIQDLGSLPGWTPSGSVHYSYEACDISADGRLMVGSVWSSTGEVRAFFWTQGLGMIDLREYLTGIGVNITGITDMSPRAVSADGTAIVGAATFNGQRRAFLIRGLHLVPDPCPADISGNGEVNGVDLTALLGAWGTNGQGEFDCDIDNDGIVSGTDLAIILGSWGTCPN